MKATDRPLYDPDRENETAANVLPFQPKPAKPPAPTPKPPLGLRVEVGVKIIGPTKEGA